MTKQTQEQVAKTLEDSGLFKIYTALYEVTWQCGEIEYSKFVIGIADSCELVGRTLTADQSEAILAEMGLQVVYDGNAYIIVTVDLLTHSGYRSDHIEYYPPEINSISVINVLKGQRTLANNTAIAWCCDNMRAELELAINTINQK